MKININVIGLGFVGLTTALGFSEKKIKTICVEKDLLRLRKIKNGSIPFEEPHLKNILKKNLLRKNLLFSNIPILEESAINVIFICVGTPSNQDGSINLKHVENVIVNLNRSVKNERVLIVIKSTVLPGTISKKLIKLINKKNITICSNPEFLREGYAWQDFINTDKIVIGYQNKDDLKILRNIYKNFNGDLVSDSTDTAEFIKYLSNSLLGNLISFSNELTIIGEKNKNVNIKKSFNAVKLDKRWFGYPAMISTYLHPGLGYGGYCLPKDISAMNFMSKKSNIKNGMINSTNHTNKLIFHYQTKKILDKFKKNEKIAVLGVSFKPGSDDIRGSKSVEIIKYLLKKGYKKIYTFDPSVKKDYLKTISKKIIHSNKLSNDHSQNYILCTSWPKYIKFLRENKKLNFIDFRYQV
jgi:UDPglucose 6-dehydrogenase